MIKRLILLAVFLIWAIPVFAAGPTATISGTLLNVDSTPCPSCTIFFNSLVTQVISSTTYQPQMKSTSTDANGVISPITLPQGLVVQITVSENGATFPPYTAIVPFLSSVTFDQLNQGVLLQPLNILASLFPPTGPLNMNGQKITNQGCPTGTTDGLVWGCNANVANLTVTGTFNQVSSGSAFFGLLTNTAIATPSAPVGTAIGTTGATQYYYFLVCHDANGGSTLPSASASVPNANATLTSSNYVNLTFTIPTHALNCDMLRNTANTTVGATSTTGGLALTASPFHDVSNTTAAYVIPTRNNTGDGQFAGALSAGAVPSGIATGDLSTARSATAGKVWFGSNGSQSFDFGVTTGGTFTLTGGTLALGAFAATGNGSVGGTFQVTGTTTLAAVNATTGVFSGTLTSGANSGTGGSLTLNGATSGSATIAVAAAAGTPSNINLPTTTGTAGQFLQTDGGTPQQTSWASITHGQQVFSVNGTFTTPAGVAFLTIECWGGGAGGGGYGAGLAAAGNGGNSSAVATAGSVTKCASGGGNAGTGAAASAAGVGGTGGSTITGTVKIAGGSGFNGGGNLPTTGGAGGGAPRGDPAGALSATIYGGGGYGGGTVGASSFGGGGGGAGAYDSAITATTAGATYTVTVGTVGAAGTGGTQNGNPGAVGSVVFTW